MSETLQIVLASALMNGAVTWGVMTTKLAWLRRDVDDLKERVKVCEARHFQRRSSDL